MGCCTPHRLSEKPGGQAHPGNRPGYRPIVRRIFDLRCQGCSYRKIATTLNTEQVPTPSSFYYLRQGKPNIRKEGGYWQAQTVKAILQNEVYIGHMVQNKTGNVSYKVHKQVDTPESEWIRVDGTHEPLVSMEVWELVRTIEKQNTRSRTQANGETALFAGLLRCMDCGSLMRSYHDGRRRKDGSKSSYRSYACGGKTVCTAHIMNQCVLIEVVLTDIRAKAELARRDPDSLIARIQAQRRAATAGEIKRAQAALTAIEKRLSELSRLTQAIYEDKVIGRIPEAVCVQLMNSMGLSAPIS